MQFLYVKIPVVAGLIDRIHRLEDEIDEALIETGVGAVVGWGDSLGDMLPDGTRAVAYTRIDVDVSDIASARAILRKSLPGLGAPPGTEIHFKIDQRHLKDIFSETEWLRDQAIAD